MLNNTINTENSIQNQFVYENEVWERLINFFKQENALLKNNLSIVLDNKTDREFLKLAEYFHGQFLLKDDFINELEKDIHAQESEIKNALFSKNAADKVLRRQETLRKEMSYFEKDFCHLKDDFNQVVSQFFVA